MEERGEEAGKSIKAVFAYASRCFHLQERVVDARNAVKRRVGREKFT